MNRLEQINAQFAAQKPSAAKKVEKRTPKPASNAAPSVIIIGAGVSGASAANALFAKGYTVTMIEARDRIGGRIQTDKTSLSGLVKIGAGWIHWGDGNPMTDLCKKYNI